MNTATELKQLLREIDRKSYSAYKSLKGSYQFSNYLLHIDHVQGDPFASPSKVSIEVKGTIASFPKWCYNAKHKQVALTDHLLRLFGKCIHRYQFQAKGSGKSGLLSVSQCGQEILERTSCTINTASGAIRMHMEIGFPANGRTINARELEKILFDYLPSAVPNSLFYEQLDIAKVEQIIHLAEDQHYIRKQLEVLNLCAFVANGSILPRESGVCFKPLKHAIPFQSPPSYEITINTPHRGPLTGMGIPKGITLIVGGGYHGKSTLLKALELGVYNHILDDGREYVITDQSAMKIRAEDGRSIKGTDISYFIRRLPNGKDTKTFFTADASGSTSQAANAIEAIDSGSTLLLIDEDTSATNFMIRDELMQRVVQRDQEPIIPFIQRIEQLYKEYEVSTILVAGSSGSYFHKADHIIQMNEYRPYDITSFAKKEALTFPLSPLKEDSGRLSFSPRCPKKNAAFIKEPRIKCKTLSKDAFSVNRDTLDLRYVEQLVDYEQTQALMYCLIYAQKHVIDGQKSLSEVIDSLLKVMETKGLHTVLSSTYVCANLAAPRKQEIYACFNRFREL